MVFLQMKGASILEQAFLETLMDKAWPAAERETLDSGSAGEWVLRASDGVTQRANSVWAKNLPGMLPGAPDMAEAGLAVATGADLGVDAGGLKA